MDLSQRSILFYSQPVMERSLDNRPVVKADWLLVVFPGLVWGASFLFIAEGLRAVGPNAVTFIRVLIGTCTLALFPAARKGVPAAAWPRIVLLGVLWFAFPLSMFPYAEQHVSSALTGMLNGIVPISVAIVASCIAREVPSARVASGLAVGLAGSVLIALPSVNEGNSSASGIVMILLACVSYGFALNLARPLQQEYGALLVIARALGVATLLTSPFGLRDAMGARWVPNAYLCLLALGIFGTGLAFVSIAMAAGRVGATRASAAAFLIPPVALVLGVIVRGEHVAPLSIFGGAVCLAGAGLIRPQTEKLVAPKVLQPCINRVMNG